MPSNFNGNEESRKFLFEMKILVAIGSLMIILYSWRFCESGQLLRILGVGVLVAGAALLSGFLLGFIFAIPRMGDSKGNTAALRNGNLVEISDWLTKIIVGVGLVELHSISGKLGELSSYLAPGLLPSPSNGGAHFDDPLLSAQAAGLAILIFFFPLGFLLGYVWTMIYFQRDLEGKLKDAEQEEETQKAINAAEASINMDQLDEALDIMDKVLRNDPKNGFALMTKARILKRQTLKLKQSDSPDRARLLKQAIVCVDLAIASLPKKDKGEPHYNKACYQALLGPEGLKDDILENLKAAFSLNPALRKSAEEDEDFKLLKDADPDWLKGVDELRKA